MKKVLGAIAVLVVIAGATILMLNNHGTTSPTTSGKTASTTSSKYQAVSACDILTSSVAAQILGSTATKSTAPSTDESTSDIAFSNCIYDAGPNADPPHLTSVALRSAKDSTGAASNKSVFTKAGKPPGVQPVTGYGDDAYWDPGMGELNILKGNNWYILTNYTGTSLTNGTATLAMAEQLAQGLKLQ